MEAEMKTKTKKIVRKTVSRKPRIIRKKTPKTAPEETKTLTTPEKEMESLKTEPTIPSQLKYLYATGRRKTSVATVKLFPQGEGKILVNQKPLEEHPFFNYFKQKIFIPLENSGLKEKINIQAIVKGGGMTGQRDALTLAIARALVKLNPGLKPGFRGLGLLTVDSRIKERKKYGLKRARRAPQWQKR